MVIGIGTDITQISRIRRLCERYGDVFKTRVFTEKEIEYCSGHKRSEMNFAGRWAGKEAFYKALPENLQKVSGWRHISIEPDTEIRRPIIKVVNRELKNGMRDCGIGRIFLSISHEREYCVAYVLLEKV